MVAIATSYVTSRHDTTRYQSSPCILAQENVVTCCVALVRQHGAMRRASRLARHTWHARHDKRHRRDTHDTCSDRCHSVDWGEHVHLTVSGSYSRDWCKSRSQKTKLVHANTTASSSSAILEQAQRDTHDKRDTLVTTRATVVRVGSWRDATSGISAYISCALDQDLDPVQGFYIGLELFWLRVARQFLGVLRCKNAEMFGLMEYTGWVIWDAN